MKQLQIHFLNTIWSDAILLEKDNHFCLIDTASAFYYPDLKGLLDRRGCKHLDFIILTHFHSDHYGNLARVLNEYGADKLYLKHYDAIDGASSSGTKSDEEYWEGELSHYNEILASAKNNNCELIFVDELGVDSSTLDFNGVTLELEGLINMLRYMYNDGEFKGQKRFSENFNSMAIFIYHEQHGVLLAADITTSVTEIKELHGLGYIYVDRFYKRHNLNKVELYKSAHHGGSGTNPYEFLKLLSPDYLVITNTARWLDNYTTIPDMLKINPNCQILPTDYFEYTFRIGKEIRCYKRKHRSLFLKLKKN